MVILPWVSGMRAHLEAQLVLLDVKIASMILPKFYDPMADDPRRCKSGLPRGFVMIDDLFVLGEVPAACVNSSKAVL